MISYTGHIRLLHSLKNGGTLYIHTHIFECKYIKSSDGEIESWKPINKVILRCKDDGFLKSVTNGDLNSRIYTISNIGLSYLGNSLNPKKINSISIANSILREFTELPSYSIEFQDLKVKAIEYLKMFNKQKKKKIDQVS